MMKKMINVLLSIAIIFSLVACDEQQEDLSLEYAKLQKEQVESEYNSLSELTPLTFENISDSTNFDFNPTKNELSYNGKFAQNLNGMEVLYGAGDLILLREGKMFMVLYQTELNFDPMAYNDYVIIGVRVNNNILYVKGNLNGKIIFVKYIVELGKPAHVYVYGY